MWFGDIEKYFFGKKCYWVLNKTWEIRRIFLDGILNYGLQLFPFYAVLSAFSSFNPWWFFVIPNYKKVESIVIHSFVKKIMNFVNKLKEKKNLVILAAISNIAASTLKWKMRFPYHILGNRLQFSHIFHLNYFIWVLAFYLSQKINRISKNTITTAYLRQWSQRPFILLLLNITHGNRLIKEIIYFNWRNP